MASTFAPAAVRLDPRSGLDELVQLLAADGYRVLGPVVRDDTIVYDEVTCGDDLPIGVTLHQAPGRSRLHHDAGELRFAYTPGADSWKRVVLPPRQEVLRIRRTDGSFAVVSPPAPQRPVALIGARDCEVRALAILDRVELDPSHPDPRYAQRRDGMLIVAVTCGSPSDTCWCTSMGGGPQPREGYDIRLTEVVADGVAGACHRLIAEAGSERGAEILARLESHAVTGEELRSAQQVADAAAAAMPVRVPGAQLATLLAGKDTDAHWARVAHRCLSCGNCTMVCPTCFCTSFSDHTALTDDGSGPIETVREQQWVSCHQLDHSDLGARPVRATTADRYRQWLLHKLQTWTAQFGTSGCVGCGRCSTWCPAGIDLPHEAAVLIGAAQATYPGGSHE